MHSYADYVQCYFSFDGDSSVDMTKNKIRGHKCLHGYAPTFEQFNQLSFCFGKIYTLLVNDDNLLLQTATTLNFAKSQSMFSYASPRYGIRCHYLYVKLKLCIFSRNVQKHI